MSSNSDKKRRGRPSVGKPNNEIDETLESSGNVNEVSDVVVEDASPVVKKTISAPPRQIGDNSDDKKTDSVSEKPIDDIVDSDKFDENLAKNIEKQIGGAEGFINEIPETEIDDANPLNDSVKSRDYTGGMVEPANNSNSVAPQNEVVINEPNYQGGGADTPDVDEKLINPNHVNSNKTTTSNDGNKNTSTPSDSNNSGSSSDNKQSQPQPQPVQEEPNTKNLSPKEKREAIEKTADAILLQYQQFLPVPFIFFASYNEKKLEKLHKKNEINLDAQIKRDGTTFREHVRNFNEKMQESFLISDKEIEDIREPLIDVLMEKDIALTPVQRLIGAVGASIVPKIFILIKHCSDRKDDMEEMKAMHLENMEMLRSQKARKVVKKPVDENQQQVRFNEDDVRQQHEQQYSEYQQNAQQETANIPNQNLNNNIEVVQPVNETSNSVISDAKIIEEVKSPVVSLVRTPTLDEVLDAENEEEEEDDDIDEKDDVIVDDVKDNKDNENDIPD